MKEKQKTKSKMARARSKEQLIQFGTEQFEILNQYSTEFESNDLLKIEVFENRTIKDIIAHLHAWHELFFIWYEEGMKNLKPAIPAPGYTFKTTPELNEKLYQEYKDMTWNEVLKKFNESHKKIMKLIEGHSEKELFTKKKYSWTGTTSMGSYFASATSSHYIWANELLKRCLKYRQKL